MKKATLQTLFNDLSAMNYDQTILDEIATELNKGEQIKSRNAKLYAELHDYVMDVLRDLPTEDSACTVNELWESLDVPECFSQSKVQYGLTHLWQDEVERIESKPCRYRLKRTA